MNITAYRACVSSLLLLVLSLPARAERADREKPIQLEADRMSIDDIKKVQTLEGNVVLIQGTLEIRTNRLVVFADADGLVFDWDWIESDPKDPLLPEASPDRFSRRVPTPRIELELGGLAPGKFTGGFASHSWVGDCVFTYVSDKPAYAKRVDAKLTVFRDFVRHTAVGFKLKDAASVRGSIEGSTSVSRLLVAAAHLTGENEHLADFLPRFGGLTAVEWHSDMTNPRASSGGHAMRAPE